MEILKVKDEEARRKALNEVVHPKFQVEPLSRDKAVSLVRDKFVRPEVEVRMWEERREGLERKYPDGVILSYEKSQEIGRAGCELVLMEAKPDFSFEFLCQVSPDEEEDERPTWGELAVRYGAILYVAAPVEPKGAAREVVDWRCLYEADVEQGMGDTAVFRKPSASDEGKAERLDREREAEGMKARTRLVEAERREVILQLSGGSLAAVLPVYVEAWLDDYDHEETACAVYQFLHPEAEVSPDDDEVREWVRELVRKRGLEGLVWLEVAFEVYHRPVGELRRYAEAVGNAQEFPEILGGWEGGSDE